MDLINSKKWMGKNSRDKICNHEMSFFRGMEPITGKEISMLHVDFEFCNCVFLSSAGGIQRMLLSRHYVIF
jgi:hypothetical protein